MKKIKLDEKERFIKYNKETDITIIEIKPKDNIKDKFFLFPETNDLELLNKDIYIPQYREDKRLSYSEGKIKEIKEHEISYDACTDSGSSGSPIFLKNTSKVIGIHQKEHISKKLNIGTVIKPFIYL